VARDVPGWFMVTLNRHDTDWLWGLSSREAAEMGPLMQRLSAAARAEVGAERVCLMGFGEQCQHFHFMLLSRSVTTPQEHRGTALLERAPELADRRCGCSGSRRIPAHHGSGPRGERFSADRYDVLHLGETVV
jgi:hypothetical protein